MSAQPVSAHAVKGAAASLRGSMAGSVLQPGDAEYAAAVETWARSDTQPAIVARCSSVSDVQQAVRVALQFQLPLAVRGGGHDWAGRSLCPGIVVDLRSLNAVTVDTERQTVTFGGGALMSDVADAVGAHGLAAIVGSTGRIGMTGFTLAGGLGPLNSRFGLGSDNILSAQVVLADGSLTTASADQDADLLWALRGGGGAFGVVTSMTCRAHPVSDVLYGPIMFPLSEDFSPCWQTSSSHCRPACCEVRTAKSSASSHRTAWATWQRRRRPWQRFTPSVIP
jgi:FAD/FMN-containing dehydrogenase